MINPDSASCFSAGATTPFRAARAEDVYPLSEFYKRAQRPLPRLDVIEGHLMPEPFRSLLVHQGDMTPTLEKHYGSDIHLQVLHRERKGSIYVREVVLHLDRDGRAVEYGANRIDLELFSPELRESILAERIPLGHLLHEYRVPHTSCPTAYLRLQTDTFMAQALGLEEGEVVYGRKNTLWSPSQKAISEIVELLPSPDCRLVRGEEVNTE